jgi:two-component system LytT family sensor kinase
MLEFNPRFLDRFFNKTIPHLLFWIIFILFWTALSAGVGILNALTNALIFAFFHSIVAYTNIYILFPKLLQKRKYLLYLLFLLGSMFLACFPIAWCLSMVNTLSDVWSPLAIISSFLSIFYTVAIVMVLKLTKSWYDRDKRTKELEKESMQAELKFLKSQINPHFLFNSLNSLYSLTLKKSDRAPELVLKLSEILRYLLYESGEEKVSLEKEIAYLKNYIELEQIRQGERARISLEINGEINGQLIEPMLFLPFVENSFKHGINSQLQQVWVEMKLNTTESELQFEIENSKSGSGRVYGNDKSHGIGLLNVKKRLELLYPAKHELAIFDLKNSYKVVLSLKLR